MTTRLSLYNRALRHLGHRTLASLTESVEARRALDAAWDGGFIRYCLEQGQWNFATRTASLSYSPSVETGFGYSRAFDVPDDWVRTIAVSADEFFAAPLNDIMMEGSYWYCGLDTIYVRYVSDDASFGSDLSLWPETFTHFAAAHLAKEACSAITGSESKIDRMTKEAKRLLADARGKDAMNEGTSFPPTGSWVRARRGSRASYDRGSRSNLTG